MLYETPRDYEDGAAAVAAVAAGTSLMMNRATLTVRKAPTAALKVDRHLSVNRSQIRKRTHKIAVAPIPPSFSRSGFWLM